ncbi:hypothetical protein F2Q69_00000226 [Brassica cretica]|uniref:Uncharacterized protein n=1 Tax=Brassica cretica TaxID=69181 RepID=A0A8S9NZA8_BRACR|nr:hypothetical protein F2Q69_00000226 [Brassica cretica]
MEDGSRYQTRPLVFAAKRDVELRNMLRHRRWRDGQKAVDGSSVKKAMIKTRKNKGTKSYSSDDWEGQAETSLANADAAPSPLSPANKTLLIICKVIRFGRETSPPPTSMVNSSCLLPTSLSLTKLLLTKTCASTLSTNTMKLLSKSTHFTFRMVVDGAIKIKTCYKSKKMAPRLDRTEVEAACVVERKDKMWQISSSGRMLIKSLEEPLLSIT